METPCSSCMMYMTTDFRGRVTKYCAKGIMCTTCCKETFFFFLSGTWNLWTWKFFFYLFISTWVIIHWSDMTEKHKKTTTNIVTRIMTCTVIRKSPFDNAVSRTKLWCQVCQKRPCNTQGLVFYQPIVRWKIYKLIIVKYLYSKDLICV